MEFMFIKFKGYKLNPENFGGREPDYKEVYELFSNGKILLEKNNYVTIRIKGIVIPSNRNFEETIWLSKETYLYARNILAPKYVFYEAHEGVTFTAAKGAWLITGDPQSIRCPPGISGECVMIQTKLGEKIGLEPFAVEKKFVFRGLKGEGIEIGYVKKYEYFIAAFDIDKGVFLNEKELKKTLLYRNYLSNPKIIKVLQKVSKHLKKEIWHLERMNKKAISKYKVVWRDVARRFIPAIVTDGSIPSDHVQYIVVNKLEEAYYLLAVFLAPQINAVVKETYAWIGQIRPRFIRYFKIPKFNANNKIHVKLANIGKEIHNKKSVTSSQISEIENLVNQL